MDEYVERPSAGTGWLWLVALLVSPAYSEAPPPAHPAVTLDRSAACTDSDWIGVLKDRTDPRRTKGQPPLECPPDWEWVFGSSTDPSQPPPPGLQRFCRYVGDAEDPRYPDRKIVEDGYVRPAHDLESITRDCRIVGPAAEPLFPAGSFGGALRARFLREARRFGLAQIQEDSADRVRLVIVDSVQDDDDPGDRACPAAPSVGDLECSRHGEVLVDLARGLLCTGADCAAEITTRRVLRGTHSIQPAGASPAVVELGLEDPAGTVAGGSFGSLRDLALAIRRAVQPDDLDGPDRPNVIVSLSVGWESIHAADSPLVRAALRDAACRGALVLAAAGNRVAGPAYLETPLLPAAWEQEPAPTLRECRALLEPGARLGARPETSYTPLLFAVGGVQPDGRLLSNARPHATPRLVAIGDHASKVFGSSPPRHETLTGTSVSTLVVSAAAARRWSDDVRLAAADVMQALWDAADPGQLPRPVDFCLEPETSCRAPETRNARRIYVGPPAAPASPSPPVELPFNDSYVAARVRAVGLSTLADLPLCRPRRLETPAKPPGDAELCPQRFFDVAVQPWLGPQPGSNHCPDCTFTQASPGTILLELDPRYRVEGIPAVLSDFTLIVGDTAYRLSDETLVLGGPDTEPRQILLTGFDFREPPHPMYLAVTVNGTYATLTPILQIRGKAFDSN